MTSMFLHMWLYGDGPGVREWLGRSLTEGRGECVASPSQVYMVHREDRGLQQLESERSSQYRLSGGAIPQPA